MRRPPGTITLQSAYDNIRETQNRDSLDLLEIEAAGVS